MSFQMVGTAMVTVGRVAAMSVVSGAAWRYCLGNTKSAPPMNPAYGAPHALAWNMGTMINSRSRSVMPNTGAPNDASECSHVERCE